MPQKKRGSSVADSPRSATASSSSSSTRKVRLTKRVVNTKRHTIGYLAGQTYYSTSQITQMAKKNQVSNVRVVGNHIQAVSGGRRLIELPTVVRGRKIEKR